MKYFVVREAICRNLLCSISLAELRLYHMILLNGVSLSTTGDRCKLSKFSTYFLPNITPKNNTAWTLKFLEFKALAYSLCHLKDLCSVYPRNTFDKLAALECPCIYSFNQGQLASWKCIASLFFSHTRALRFCKHRRRPTTPVSWSPDQHLCSLTDILPFLNKGRLSVFCLKNKDSNAHLSCNFVKHLVRYSVRRAAIFLISF